MTDQFHRTEGDAPGGWEGYSELLKEHGRRKLSPGRSQQLVEEWESLVAKRKRARNLRVGLGVPTGLAVVTGLVLLFGSIGERAEHQLVPAVEIPAPKVVKEEVDIFANPAIPPVWYDTALPPIDVNLPSMHMDSALFDLQTRMPTADSPVAGEPPR
ncbi:MAG: hypothetical protein KDD67_00940 [Ignavibacteriae bacterium]|nr:hypothetical protein [Ignavibacteriota bacterium]MCB9216610.1 hypothetical protein [Ignavibacteria bacterium]